MLLIIMAVVPLIVLVMTWRFYAKESGTLLRWRKIVFLAGFCANLVSAAVLVTFLLRAYIASRGTTSVDLDRIYPVLTMLGLGVAASGLATVGTRVSRLLLIGSGLLTAVFWYLAALGASV